MLKMLSHNKRGHALRGVDRTHYRVVYCDLKQKTEHTNAVTYTSATLAEIDAIETISNVKAAFPNAVIGYRVEPCKAKLA